MSLIDQLKIEKKRTYGLMLSTRNELGSVILNIQIPVLQSKTKYL